MKRIQVTFSDTEIESLRRLADADGRSLSAVVGYLTTEALALRGALTPTRSGKPLRRSRYCGRRPTAVPAEHTSLA